MGWGGGGGARLGGMGAADRARTLVDGLRNSGGFGMRPSRRPSERCPGTCSCLRPLARAYADEAVAVQSVDGVTTSSASQPSMMAIMLEQLDLRPGHRVLEVGAGTGYNAALLARIVGPLAGSSRSTSTRPDRGCGPAPRRRRGARCRAGVRGRGAGSSARRAVRPHRPHGRQRCRPPGVDRASWPRGRLLLPLALRGTQLSVALDLGDDGMLRSATVHRCAFVRLRGMGATAGADGGRRACPWCRPTARHRSRSRSVPRWPSPVRRGLCRGRWARVTSGTASGCGSRSPSRGVSAHGRGRSIRRPRFRVSACRAAAGAAPARDRSDRPSPPAGGGPRPVRPRARGPSPFLAPIGSSTPTPGCRRGAGACG